MDWVMYEMVNWMRYAMEHDIHVIGNKFIRDVKKYLESDAPIEYPLDYVEDEEHDPLLIHPNSVPVWKSK